MLFPLWFARLLLARFAGAARLFQAVLSNAAARGKRRRVVAVTLAVSAGRFG
jgi:hypothetical protein